MSNNRKKIDFVSIFCCTLGIIYVVVTLGVMLWGVLASFMPSRFFDYTPTKIPDRLVFENYTKIWKEFYVRFNRGSIHKTFWIEGLFFNGFVYALGCAFASVFICSLTAYMAAQYKYKFSGLLVGIVLFTMSFPVVGNMAGELAILKFLGLYDTFIGMLVLKGNFLGMYFLVFYTAFKSVPKDYSEAARIDGAGHFSVMFRIYFPMIANALLTVLLLYFIMFWNDYQTPMLYLPSMPTASYGLFLYNNRGGAEAPFTTHKLAASMIVLLPSLVIFLAFQKRLIGKISLSGGVKE